MKNIKSKIKDLPSLKAILEREKSKGRTVVFTNGCFDIIHIGHVRYLYQAKSFGDLLVIGLNSDSSVKSYKGAGRPINPENERAEVLASLEMIDYVVIFSERTPERLIKELRPDVQVKGGDYTKDQVPEARALESYGGRLEIVPFVDGASTTGAIERIRNILKEENSRKDG